MTAYWISYAAFSIILLVFVNLWLRKKRQKVNVDKVAGNQLDEEKAPIQPILSHEKMESGQKKEKDLHIGRLMTVLMLGAFVTILNQTLVNVALPKMMLDLNVSANVIQWMVTGYMLVNGVLIPISAYLIERLGTRRLFIAAMVSFTLGAVICSLSTNFPLMLTGRLIQGIGAGVIMPLMMTIFLTVFPVEKRGKAMGTMGIAIIFAPAIGPTLSGWIVEHYTWRLLFTLVIPIGIIDLLLALAWLTNVTRQSKIAFDFPGFLFSTLGFGGILYGFSEAGSNGWKDGLVILSLLMGVIFLILFVWRELTAKQPMLDLRVFKFNVFTLTTVISSVLNMALFAAMVLLPIYLQNIRGFTPLESGLLLLPGAIIMGIMSPISGAIFDRIGARYLAIVGLIITVVTTWEFSKLSMDTTYAHILLLYCMRMLGMSLIMMTIMTEGMNQLPRALHSHGTATSNTLRQVAGSLGTALLVTIMTNRTSFHLGNLSNEITSTNSLLFQKLSAMGQGVAAIAGLPQGSGTALATQLLYGIAAKESMVNGINDSFIIATGIAVVALILSFFLKSKKRQKEEVAAPETK